MLMILLGLFLIVLGTVMLVFNREIYGFTGGIDFVEHYFRAGTPAFLKLFSLALVLIGIMMATGFGSWLTKPLSNAFDSFRLK